MPTVSRPIGGNQNFKYFWLDLEESLKVQLSLLERGNLPVVGVESARKVLDPSIQSNRLIQQAETRSRPRAFPTEAMDRANRPVVADVDVLSGRVERVG